MSRHRARQKLIHDPVRLLAAQPPDLPGAEVPLPLPRVQPHQHLPGVRPCGGAPAEGVPGDLPPAEPDGAQPRVRPLDVARGDALREDLRRGGRVGEGELEAGGGELRLGGQRSGSSTPRVVGYFFLGGGFFLVFSWFFFFCGFFWVSPGDGERELTRGLRAAWETYDGVTALER